jgi:hypothetical protein
MRGIWVRETAGEIFSVAWCMYNQHVEEKHVHKKTESGFSNNWIENEIVRGMERN